jgi:predicted CopG family antitoxin
MLNTKTINVSEEAFNALMKERRGNENLSQTILRLTKNTKTVPVNIGKRIVESERDNVPHTFGDGWFNSSDLL